MPRTTIIPILAATALAALAAPAAASAAPSWTSPSTLAPAPSGGVAAPAQAFVSGAGRSLVVSSDGTAPWLASGDRSGTFGARAALGTLADGTASVDADLGADGTLAVAWATGNAVHVTVVPAGMPARPQIDLPAAGANGVAVAVAPDGAITVAYRTKNGSTYGVDVASAPAGGTFGVPVTVDSGTSGIDSPDVEVGAGGLTAVTYRKIISRYRARVAVRLAGAAAFEAPQTVSSGDPAVIRTRVALGSDGSVVAVWADGAAAQYAVRAAAGAAFGAPTTLGENAYAVNLVSTPQGGTAAAWAGNGTIQAAVQAPGVGFGAPATIASYSGQIVTDPVIAVAPDGVASVAYGDPTDGAVRVADIGGASTVVGYGKPEHANAVAIASGADRTIAVWTDAAGGTSVATRSETATAGSPGSKPAAPDKSKPKLTIVTRSRTVKVTSKTTSIKLQVRCNEACSLSATADLQTRRGKKTAHAPTRPYTSKRFKTGTQTVTLKLGSLAGRDLRRALRTGRGGHMTVDLTAADRSRNSTRQLVRLRLVKKSSGKR